MRVPRILQFRISAPSRWSFQKEGIFLAGWWVALGTYTIVFLFFVPGADRDGIMLNSIIAAVLLGIPTLFRFLEKGFPWKKKTNKPDDESDDGDGRDNGEDYKPPTWISPEERTDKDFAEDKPWLVKPSEDYTLEVDIKRPRVRRIKGPIRDDP